MWDHAIKVLCFMDQSKMKTIKMMEGLTLRDYIAKCRLW